MRDNGRAEGKKNVRKYKKNIFIFLAIVVFFIIVEAFSGLLILVSHHLFGTPKRISIFRFHPLFTRENVSQYESNWTETYPVFGYVNRIHNSDECGYTTDKQGFIHNGDKSRVITPDQFTIFIFGGSTVAGHGSSCNNRTISAYLEKILRKKYPLIQVINAGVAGYFSAQEFRKFANEVIFYDPDIVIFIDGVNDFMEKNEFYTYKGKAHTYFISDYDVKLDQTLAQTRSVLWSLKNFVYNLTQFTEYTYTRFVFEKGVSFLIGRTRAPSKNGPLENVKSIVGIKSKPQSRTDIEDDFLYDLIDKRVFYYTTYLFEAQNLVVGMGKKYYHILQPVLFTETRVLPREESDARELAQYAFYKKQGIDVVKRSKYFWNRTNEVTKALNIKSYDFRNIFPDGDNVYSDFAHYNDHGNFIIAEKISEILLLDKAITQ